MGLFIACPGDKIVNCMHSHPLHYLTLLLVICMYYCFLIYIRVPCLYPPIQTLSPSFRFQAGLHANSTYACNNNVTVSTQCLARIDYGCALLFSGCTLSGDVLCAAPFHLFFIYILTT
jgi:hypothetical protein